MLQAARLAILARQLVFRDVLLPRNKTPRPIMILLLRTTEEEE
jgi:hypothetical protein